MLKHRRAIVVGGAILFGISMGAYLLWNYRATGRVEQDFGAQMIRYTKQGRYDDAVQVGLHTLRNNSDDEFVYQQISIVYSVRAYKDSKHREEWVTNGVSYIEKSLALNSKEKDVAGVSLLQDALSFKDFGNLSADRRCTYYDRARSLLEDRAPVLQGEKLTLEGRDFPLAPLRQENDKYLNEVNEKIRTVGCK